MDQVILNVRMQAHPGREADLETQLRQLIAPTRAEAGCIQYELHRSTETNGLFMFCETFASQAALDAHIATSHFQEFVRYREQNDPVATVQVTRWIKIG